MTVTVAAAAAVATTFYRSDNDSMVVASVATEKEKSGKQDAARKLRMRSGWEGGMVVSTELLLQYKNKQTNKQTSKHGGRHRGSDGPIDFASKKIPTARKLGACIDSERIS